MLWGIRTELKTAREGAVIVMAYVVMAREGAVIVMAYVVMAREGDGGNYCWPLPTYIGMLVTHRPTSRTAVYLGGGRTGCDPRTHVPKGIWLHTCLRPGAPCTRMSTHMPARMPMARCSHVHGVRVHTCVCTCLHTQSTHPPPCMPIRCFASERISAHY